MAVTRRQQKPEDNRHILLPDGFVEEICQLFPADGARLAEAISDEPQTSVRYNTHKFPVDAGNGLTPVEWCDTGFYLERREDFVHDPLFHAGTYYVQEAASMIYQQLLLRISELETSDEPFYVLDSCASPGGKTTALLNSLPSRGVVVANEFDRKRAVILKENLDKWGDGRVIVTNSDTAAFSKLRNLFDIVVVDAPCSGEGLMRREPVAKSQWSHRLVESCAALQRDITANLIPSIKEGGYLIYSTCTFNSRENEDNVRRIMETYGLESVDLKLTGTEGIPGSLSPDIPALRFMPHEVRCEGLFVAVLRKPEAGLESRVRPASPGKKQKFDVHLTATGREYILEEAGDRIYALPSESAALYQILKKTKGINIISAGTESYEVKGKLRIPSSRMVLNPDFASEFPILEIDRDSAVRYLKREPITIPAGVPAGYVTVSHAGFPLGLIKNLGTRANNLYPNEWRVRT